MHLILKMCKSDRFEKFGIKIKAPNFRGKYIISMS